MSGKNKWLDEYSLENPPGKARHKWEVICTPDDVYVKRDGVEWTEVYSAEAFLDAESLLPRLTLDCYVRTPLGDPLSDPKFVMARLEMNRNIHRWEVWRGEELIEEAVFIELETGTQPNFMPRAKITVLADIEWRSEFKRSE